MKLTLTQPIFSSASKGRLYADIGEVVTLVSEHGKVLIVAGKKQSFPVLKSKTDYGED